MKNILILSVILGLFLIGCSVEPLDETSDNSASTVVAPLPLPTIFSVVAVNTIVEFTTKLTSGGNALPGIWFHDGALRSSFPAEDDGTNIIKIKSNAYGRAVTVNLRFYCISSSAKTIQASNDKGSTWYNTATVANSMAATQFADCSAPISTSGDIWIRVLSGTPANLAIAAVNYSL